MGLELGAFATAAELRAGEVVAGWLGGLPGGPSLKP